jgi:hypothetical protein
MLTVGQILKDYKGSVKNFKGTFGLEIETQAKAAYDPRSYSFWNVHRDDSLRGPGPFEYILKAPLDWGDQLDAALDEFKEKTAELKWMDKPTEQWTTSVHVHINMQNENLLTFGNFLTTYALTENLLVEFAGENRQSNLFCLALKDAESNFHTMQNLITAFRDKRYHHLELSQQENKYAGLNLASLWQMGSLECRLMRGTTDIDLIRDWVGMFHRMLQFSRKDITPKDIVLAWKSQGTQILSDIFGPYRKLLNKNGVINEQELTEKNFWYAANLSIMVKDWKSLVVVKKEINPTPELFAKLAKLVYSKNSFEELNEEQKLDLYTNFEIYVTNDAKKRKKKDVLDPFDAAQAVAIQTALGAQQPDVVMPTWATGTTVNNTATLAGLDPGPEPVTFIGDGDDFDLEDAEENF